MNEPTDRDLQALVAEARREHGEKECEVAKEGPSLARWMWWIHGLASKALRSGEATREALLHIALFALRAAW